MRTLLRNKTKFYYATYFNENPIVDEYGNATGEYKVSYGLPTEYFGNISPANGEKQTEQFGESESYDKVIVLDDRNALIDEHSILWVDTLPYLNSDGTTETPHDYIVKKVARSLNGMSIAIRKVIVDG